MVSNIAVSSLCHQAIHDQQIHGLGQGCQLDFLVSAAAHGDGDTALVSAGFVCGSGFNFHQLTLQFCPDNVVAVDVLTAVCLDDGNAFAVFSFSFSFRVASIAFSCNGSRVENFSLTSGVELRILIL